MFCKFFKRKKIYTKSIVVIIETLKELFQFEELSNIKVSVGFEKDLCSFVIEVYNDKEVSDSLKLGIQKKFKNIISNKGINFNYIFMWRN